MADDADPATLIANLRASFPWLDQVGFTPEWFQELVADSASPAEILVKARQTPQYRARFGGMWRQDGSVRMNEAEYLRAEKDYRQVLTQFGYGADYQDNRSLVGFFNSEVDPNELRDRLGVYQGVQRSGAAVKDAFYVYAGIKLTDDDLYAAVVDPAARDRLVGQYNDTVAKSPSDYSTYINRATEVGLSRASATLQQLRDSGAISSEAMQRVLRVSPDYAAKIVDVLNSGAGTASPLSLQELVSSFEYAALGAAAVNAGLELPSKQRVGEIRSAGIDRARASQVYSEYGRSRGAYEAAAARIGTDMSQSKFESAMFLGDATAANDFVRAMEREKAAGETGGGFGFSFDRSGRMMQGSMRAPQ